MKYIKEYLETVVKIKPLGELTTKEDELNGLSGEMAYIDGKCTDIFISHADYANWLENKYEQKKCCGEVNDIAMQQQLQIWFDKGKCSGRDEVIFHPENYGLQKQREQKPIEEINGEDYGIDGLYHAQRILEKTLGEVDGYQSDDGILDHKAAITVVKKLYEQKPAECIKFNNEFENQISRLLVSVLNKEHEYNEGFVKYAAQSLLGYAKNELKSTEWSEEDEKMFRSLHNLIYVVRDCDCDSKKKKEYSDWLKYIKDRGQSKQEQEWSKEDEKFFKTVLWHISYSISNGESTDIHCDTTEWFKSLKERYTWNPSDEQITWLYRAADDASKDSRMKQILNELLSDLKKLKGE